jgi:hypothetical protein
MLSSYGIPYVGGKNDEARKIGRNFRNGGFDRAKKNV